MQNLLTKTLEPLQVISVDGVKGISYEVGKTSLFFDHFESNNIIENARTKIHKKNLDYIVANDITASDAGFGSEDNRVTILSKDGETLNLDKMSKSEVACNIFDMILRKR